MNRKLIVILGPTASGKTALSIKLAKKFKGEVVSADSRQVYKGMDIGTGKVTKKEMSGIPHYLLNVASPKRKFTVAQYQRLFQKAINKIHKKGKVPFLVGGTGFYIQSVVDGIIIPEVKPDWKLRKKLEKKPVSELYEMLSKLDPIRASAIDKNNPRRIIRALEIVLKSKRPVGPLSSKRANFKALDNGFPNEERKTFKVLEQSERFLFLGVKRDKNELKKLIEKRLLKRLTAGMVEEVKKLRKSGLSWKRLEEFGLEYRYIAQYLQKKISYQEMVEKIQKESEKFAKRQMTWFKRDKRIKWIKNHKEAKKIVNNFLEKQKERKFSPKYRHKE